jgi:hypothetical protein
MKAATLVKAMVVEAEMAKQYDAIYGEHKLLNQQSAIA